MTPRTAFLVIVPEEGVPYAVLGTASIDVVREPSMSDVRSACQEIASDLVAQAAAQYAARMLAVEPAPTPAAKVRKALKQRSEE